MFIPIAVSPLPLLAWQSAQFCAQFKRASCKASLVAGNGFFKLRACIGTAIRRAVVAATTSIAVGLSRVLNP